LSQFLLDINIVICLHSFAKSYLPFYSVAEDAKSIGKYLPKKSTPKQKHLDKSIAAARDVSR
jgi:hypothetical protein